MNQIFYQVRYALPVWFCLLIASWLPDNRISIRIRGFLVSLFLPCRPAGLTLGRDVTLLGIDKLNLGRNVYLAKSVWINAHGSVVIEDEVMLAPYVVVVSTKHGYINDSVYGGGWHFAPVRVGKGTWVAAHCTITSGIRIGSGCLIGANSVVTQNIADNTIAGGVPAKVIKPRSDKSGMRHIDE